MNKYDYDVKKVLKLSEKEMYNLSHPYVGSEHFILAILSYNNEVSELLERHNITYRRYKNMLNNTLGNNKVKNKYMIYTPLLKRIIDSDNYNSSSKITIRDTFLALLDEGEGIGLTILKKLNCDLDSVYKELSRKEVNIKNSVLLELGTNLNELSKNKELDRVVGREKEINRLMEILARKNKNNPILIGDAGVGKTAIVEGLAERIIEKNVPDFLKNKKIISLNMSSVISGTKYRGEFEEKVTKILKELENNNDYILFIDEIHTLVGAGGAEGAIDASNILKPSLARGKIRCIGATTTDEYKKFIEKDKALDRRFQRILVKSPNTSETIKILTDVKEDYESFHNVKISKDLIEKIVNLSNRYIHDRNEPDRSLDILDEVCAKAKILDNEYSKNLYKIKLDELKKKKSKLIKEQKFKEAILIKKDELKINKLLKTNTLNEISYKIVKEVIESKSNSKIDDIETIRDKKQTLINKLSKTIIGQKLSIESFINSIVNVDIYDEGITTYLLKGPGGTGKCKLIKEYTNEENINLIKLDMADFTNEMSLTRLTGSPHGYVGYDDQNTVFESIKLNPSSIILFKNIEKAHRNVLNLIYSIIDDSIFINSKNEKINFKNCKFIFTTTTSKEKKSIGFNSSKEEESTLPKDLLERVTETIEFKELTKNDIKKIITIELKKQNSSYSEDKLNIIIDKTDYKKQGAKKVKSAIRKSLESEVTA